MSARKRIPADILTQVLATSRRRCCICFGLNEDAAVKQGQVAHLDHDCTNNQLENLAFLCLEHHDRYDASTSQSKGFTLDEVKHYCGCLVAFLNRKSTPSSLPSGEVVAPLASRQPTRRALQAEIRRNMRLRDRMRKDFLKPVGELIKLRPFYHPYDKFAHSEAIIRKMGDATYPDRQDSPGSKISGWFKVELYDFYHNGLAVILGISRAVLDAKGRWAIVPGGGPIDPALREGRAWRLGRIPWSNICEYDVEGDEYYNIPHIYCDFADSATPYEALAYAMLGDKYDWPLTNGKRIEAFALKPTMPSGRNRASSM